MLATGAASANTTVRYTEVIRSILYLPTYIADKNGYFKEQGLDVDWGTAWGADKAVPLLISGNVDVALVGPEVQIFIENSPSPVKTKIFCKLAIKDGLLLVSREKMAPEDFKWEMLKGKDFLSFPGATTPQIDAAWVLKKHGVDPKKDLQNYLTSITSANRDAAWVAGTGDFGTFFAHTASMFERDGHGTIVASIGEEIGPYAYTTFLATDKYIAQNPKAIQGWCNAIQQAQRFVADTQPAELATLVTSYFPQLGHEVLENSIKLYKDLDMWSVNVTTSPEDIDKVQDIMEDGGVLKPEQRVPYDRAVVRTFSENANKGQPR